MRYIVKYVGFRYATSFLFILYVLESYKMIKYISILNHTIVIIKIHHLIK